MVRTLLLAMILLVSLPMFITIGLSHRGAELTLRSGQQILDGQKLAIKQHQQLLDAKANNVEPEIINMLELDSMRADVMVLDTRLSVATQELSNIRSLLSAALSYAIVVVMLVVLLQLSKRNSST